MGRDTAFYRRFHRHQLSHFHFYASICITIASIPAPYLFLLFAFIIGARDMRVMCQLVSRAHQALREKQNKSDISLAGCAGQLPPFWAWSPRLLSATGQLRRWRHHFSDGAGCFQGGFLSSARQTSIPLSCSAPTSLPRVSFQLSCACRCQRLRRIALDSRPSVVYFSRATSFTS